MGEHNKLTPREIDIIKRLAESGQSAGAIARVLNRATSAVWAEMRRLGLAKRRHVGVALELPPKVFDALAAAAARRQIPVAQYAAMLLTGILRHGCISTTLAGVDARYLEAALRP